MKRLPYSHKILFIEDEKNLVDIYHDIFEINNILLLSTDNIEDGIIIAKKENPDLILLDLILPVTDGAVLNIGREEGLRFLELIKANKQIKDIPIVVFTNLDSRAARARTRELGAIDYIIKANYTPREAVEIIKKHLPK